jgi:hypothetical protein
VPADITVDITNATGTEGQASRAADGLSAQGFAIGTLDLTDQERVTTIRHAPDQVEAARTLQAAIPGSRLVADPDLGARLALVLGASYEGVTPIRVKAAGSSGATKPEEGTTADQDICTG